MRAIEIKIIDESEGKRQRLYELDPPLKDRDGCDHKYVIASRSVASFQAAIGYPEVYLLPSNIEGDFLSMLEIEGSQRGTTDVEKPLRDLGYEIVAMVAA